jgi:hypothetical protein
VTKVRELRAPMAADVDLLRSHEQDRARLEHYRESLVMLEEATPDHPVVRQLRFELEALAALPPRIDATDTNRQR